MERALCLSHLCVGGWHSLLPAVDVDTPDTAPVRDNHPEYALYFIVFISLTNFFIMNLFVGVVVDHFNSAKNKLEGGLLTPQVCLCDSARLCDKVHLKRNYGFFAATPVGQPQGLYVLCNASC